MKKARSDSRLGLVLVMALLLGLGLAAGCRHAGSGHGKGTIFSSRAYQGHASDADNDNLVQVWPKIRGTRLDDCQTCHWGQPVKNNTAAVVIPNPCSYCHYLQHPPAGWTDLPNNIYDTLNQFGRDYLAHGRDNRALRKIADDDSDGDGFTNAEEIKDLRYPGSAASYPGLALCPVITVTLAQIRAMPEHVQFGLANTTKQQFDYYATYGGVKIIDLLTDQGLGGSTVASATNIDILSPDGFAQTFTVAEITNQFPPHQFFPGLGSADLGPDCGLIEYPAETYGYGYGDTIGDEQWHILAYEREGLPLDPVWLNPVSDKIEGEGPFRNIIPPGSTNYLLNQPDRGKGISYAGCAPTVPTWVYNSANDHNAGRMAKGAVIIRIKPMPTTCEEFDLINGGYGLADAEQLLIYGHGVE